MKARLAKKEMGARGGISVKRTMGFLESSLHAHDFYEIDIIVGGNARTVLNGVSATAAEGQVYFLTPDDLHEYVGSPHVDILNIQFYGNSVDSTILSQLTTSGVRMFSPARESFRNIKALYEVMEATDPDMPSADMILTKLCEAVLMIVAESGGKTAGSDESTSPYIQRALIYVQEHFKDNPTLGEVAGVVALNERYFCKRFKEYTGKTYKEYLRERKLDYARRLVLSTDMTMTEIAERSGYGSQAHFNREWKRRFGISPLEMKDEINKAKRTSQ